MRRSDLLLENLLTLHPKRIDLTLDRVYALLEKLGNPQLSLPPVVHIAGTNGKGSTLAYIKAIAEEAGLRVHRYSSPHLVRFHERITLAGETITEESLSTLLEEVEKIQGDAPITFFEITTAAAMLAFSRTPADILLLETGLGGRLDATNVVPKPMACVLSPIGIDHQEFLGKTLELIAKEKVAIARAGVPLISAVQRKEPERVIDAYCNENHIPLWLGGRDWQHRINDRGFVWQEADREEKHFPHPALPGIHQIDNAALAITVTQVMINCGFKITQGHINDGLQKAEWLGRLQKLDNGRFVDTLPDGVTLWLDGGHNLDAGRILRDFLGILGDVRLIIGMLGNKDCTGYLHLLEDYLNGAQSLTIPHSEASLSAKDIASIHPKITPAENFDKAITKAARNGGKNIIVCGSLYLIGALLAENDA